MSTTELLNEELKRLHDLAKSTGSVEIEKQAVAMIDVKELRKELTGQWPGETCKDLDYHRALELLDALEAADKVVARFEQDYEQVPFNMPIFWAIEKYRAARGGK